MNHHIAASAAARAKCRLGGDQLNEDEIEFDGNPQVSESEDGAWVQAWIYIRKDEYETKPSHPTAGEVPCAQEN